MIDGPFLYSTFHNHLPTMANAQQQVPNSLVHPPNRPSVPLPPPLQDAPPLSTATLSTSTRRSRSPSTARDVTQQNNKKRCFHPECRKKVSIIGECKCGFIFCSRHRLPENHLCHYDHQRHDRAHLERVLQGGGTFEKMEKV